MSMFGGGGGGGNGGGGNSDDKDKDKGKEKEEERRVSSFRGMTESKKTAGAPAWFLDSDANKDNQVSMAEFASKLDEEKLEEYMKFDTNGDGFITVKEVLLAVKNGVLRNSVAAKPASASGPSSSGAASAAAAKSNVSMEGLPADADPKWVDFCRKRIEKIDKNKNGTVSFDEWSPSLGDFTNMMAMVMGSLLWPSTWRSTWRARKASTNKILFQNPKLLLTQFSGTDNSTLKPIVVVSARSALVETRAF